MNDRFRLTYGRTPPARPVAAPERFVEPNQAPPARPGPSFAESVVSGAKLYTVPAFAGDWLSSMIAESAIEAEPGYDVFADPQVEGFEDFMGHLAGSSSRRQTRMRIGRLRRLQADQRAAEARPLAAMIGAALDPTMVIAPFAVARGSGVAAGMARGTAGAEAVMIPLEASRVFMQPTAEPGEVAGAAIAAGILGATVGAAAGALKPLPRRAQEAVEQTELMLDRIDPPRRAGPAPRPFEVSPDEAVLNRLDEDIAGLTPEERAEFGATSAGAGETPGRTVSPDDPELEVEGNRPVGAAGFEYGSVSPVMRRLVRTQAAATGDALLRMVTPRFMLRRHLAGDPSPPSVAATAAKWQWPLFEGIRTANDAYLRYRGRAAGERMAVVKTAGLSAEARIRQWRGDDDAPMTYGEFRRAVGRAMHTGDRHPVPEVAEVAAFMRQHVTEPIREAANDLELWSQGLNRERDDLAQRLRDTDNRMRDVEREVDDLEAGVDAARAAGGVDAVGRIRDRQTRLRTEGEKLKGQHAKMTKRTAKIDEEIEKVRASGGIRQPANAESYFPIVWRKDLVQAHRGELRQRLMRDMLARQAWRQTQDMAALERETENLIESILRDDPFVPIDADATGAAAPFHGRKIDFIRPEDYFDFLETDFEAALRHYVRTMSVDIELTRAFGEIDMRSALKAITDEYVEKIAAATDDAAKAKLHEELVADVKVVRAMRDALRGTLGRPDDPSAWSARLVEALKSWSVLTYMGGAAISAMTDFARPVMTEGLARTLGTSYAALLRGMDTIQLGREELQLAGTALDVLLAQRSALLANSGDLYGRGARWERFLHQAAGSFSLVNLLAPETVAAKTFAGLVVQTRILDDVMARASGALSPEGLAKLARAGIGEAEAEAIAKMAAKHGERYAAPDGRGHVWLPNTEAWENPLARDAFRSALWSDVDRTIVTPNVGDPPIFMSTQLGSLLLQFRSFSLSAYQSVLVAGLQERNAATVMGVASMVALGAIADQLKAWQFGDQRERTLEERLVNAVDRSGVMAWLFDVNNMAERLTGNQLGLRAMLGQVDGRRHPGTSERLAMLAPALSQGGNMTGLLGDLLSGEADEWTAVRARRAIAYNQVFWLHGLFDELEDALKGLGRPEAAAIPSGG